MRPAFHAAAAAFGPRKVFVVEVGVERGLNAENVLAEWPFGELRLTLVEIDPEHRLEVMKRLARFDPCRYHEYILGDSAVAAGGYGNGYFDLVYLDDDHQYEGVKRSIAAWLPKVKAGGILGGHDFHRNEPGVIKAVLELVHEKDWSLNVAEMDWWTVVV